MDCLPNLACEEEWRTKNVLFVLIIKFLSKIKLRLTYRFMHYKGSK